MTEQAKPKTKKRVADVIDEGIDKGEKFGEAVKQFTPPEIDTAIDRGIEAARLGSGLFKMFKGMFSKKKIL